MVVINQIDSYVHRCALSSWGFLNPADVTRHPVLVQVWEDVPLRTPCLQGLDVSFSSGIRMPATLPLSWCSAPRCETSTSNPPRAR